MKLDLDAVEEHARYLAAVRRQHISWRIAVGASGLITLVFENNPGEPVEVAGAETFALTPQPLTRMVAELLAR